MHASRSSSLQGPAPRLLPMRTRSNVEKHLHLAMQSGSNTVLKAMNRPYTIERFQEIVDKFRAKVEGGSLTTDIIVGFPGETDEDFEETLVAVDKAKFDAHNRRLPR